MIGLPALPPDPSYWFVGANWGGADDQTARFLQDGMWEDACGSDGDYAESVARMRPGERIAIKSSSVRRHRLPFDTGGQRVPVMRIKAVGTILQSYGSGAVAVAWEPDHEAQEWYFYTFRGRVWRCDPEDDKARRLIAFAFEGAEQDHRWWLAQPYFAARYGAAPPGAAPLVGGGSDEPEGEEVGAGSPAYTVDDIIGEGCFVPRAALDDALGRLRAKLNLVVQGPPGTGKTWLAKRLAAALIGQRPEAARTRTRVVQFHPSTSYEDVVRGYRPGGDGRLMLVDGVLLQAAEAARAEGDRPYVLVIEEINRGNPAQVLGEMLTLLEHDKRASLEAVELAYPRGIGERVYLPPNLYVIATMNLADRSLAPVDLALRRRFAFVSLAPRFDAAWQGWCEREGKLPAGFVALVGARMRALNEAVAGSLGEQFAVGHSYVTPAQGKPVPDGPAWFRVVVATEIGPLLDEYWHEAPEKARAAAGALVKGL